MKIVRPWYGRSEEALEFHMYRLANTSSRYDNEVGRNVVKWAKRLQALIETSIFNPVNPISIINLLSSFNKAYDTNSIHDRAVLCLLHFFLKNQAAAALNLQIASKDNSSCRRQKERTPPTYWKVVNYLLETKDTKTKLPKQMPKS